MEIGPEYIVGSCLIGMVAGPVIVAAIVEELETHHASFFCVIMHRIKYLTGHYNENS